MNEGIDACVDEAPVSTSRAYSLDLVELSRLLPERARPFLLVGCGQSIGWTSLLPDEARGAR
jgi:hypothetical protein